MASQLLTKLLDILKYSTEVLKSANIENPRLNAELMMCDTLNCTRIKLYLDFEKPLSETERENFKIKLRRRLKGEPLQYILGYSNFLNTKIYLNKNVLIPRPETEELVEKVLSDIRESKAKKSKIYEAATGSGCISLGLSKALEKDGIEFEITATDKSDDVLSLAEYNMNVNDAKNITFVREDFFDLKGIDNSYDIFIMNPPYISLEEYQNLDKVVRDWEPRISLTDESDGYTFYKKLINLLSENKLLVKKIYCEIGYNQSEQISNLLKSKKISDFNFYKDLSGKDRILFINNESSYSKG